MTQLVLVFALGLSVHALPSPTIDDDREALEKLSTQYSRFEQALDDSDQVFAKLRRAYDSRRRSQAGALAEELTPLIRKASNEWVKLEDMFYKYRLAGVDFFRQGFRQEGSESFQDYLAMKRHNRFGNGTAIESLLRAWRGLQTGDKLVFPPSSLRRRNEFEGVRIPAYESILIMTTHGGFIRGRVEGMADDKLVLREILPNALRLHTLRGRYRQIPLEDVATIEIVRRPPTLSPQDAPTPTVTPEGEYSDYYVRPGFVTRIQYRPDDYAIYTMARDGNWDEWEDAPRVNPVDPHVNRLPAYSTLFFFDCNERLQKRIVKFPDRRD